MDERSRFLTTSEVAARLGVGPSTIRDAVRRGVLPHVAITRRRLLIPLEAVEALLDAAGVGARRTP
jgi:excisionase family DNA binding protein